MNIEMYYCRPPFRAPVPLQEIGFLTVTKSYISVTKAYCRGLMKP